LINRTLAAWSLSDATAAQTAAYRSQAEALGGTVIVTPTGACSPGANSIAGRSTVTQEVSSLVARPAPKTN
jgi:hypothetical protein